MDMETGGDVGYIAATEQPRQQRLGEPLALPLRHRFERCEGPPPQLLIEGEEESGSPHFRALVEERTHRLAADA
ncbi:hypothetical protein ABZ235_25630, partial [Streptomyces canus]|uniref:hypothetical protein n=1 Tax=Streptomyces canus TaxID=58343 RepID=UPI0033A6E575